MFWWWFLLSLQKPLGSHQDCIDVEYTPAMNTGMTLKKFHHKDLYLPERWLPTVGQNKSYKWNYLCPEWPNITCKIILIFLYVLWPSAVPWWICDKSCQKPSEKGEILGWRPDCFHSLWDIKGTYFEKCASDNLLFGSYQDISMLL